MKWQKAIEELGFGRCRRCKRPPDDFLFAEHIYWALCTPCRIAWWAMFSYDGWGLAEAEAREAESALAGWDVGGEREDAYVTGTSGEYAFAKAMGLPWHKDSLRQDFRAPDSTPFHVRTSRFESAPLVVMANDADDDIYVLVLAHDFPPVIEVVCWTWGYEAKEFGLKPIRNYAPYQLGNWRI